MRWKQRDRPFRQIFGFRVACSRSSPMRPRAPVVHRHEVVRAEEEIDVVRLETVRRAPVNVDAVEDHDVGSRRRLRPSGYCSADIASSTDSG